MEVRFGQIFLKHFNNFPKADQIKIRAFAKHIEQFGFDGLQGRNKSSDDVPMTHPNWSERILYAKTHNLWHYHIGIPHYEKSKKGDYTSEYVLHYIKGDDFVKLVDLSAHPPLNLPSLEYLV
ncbi:MAG: hypothetical protein Q4B79_07470 [Moraxella sp.]|uniref:hypothetical protein n=1 Tax=Moraxella sp. TaxID=479 RepID=UPI0026DAF6E7|nr:hypothetical protein [Moraxella sp.]MDO4450777.1 hypothetical protein [Moraxella sp.]